MQRKALGALGAAPTKRPLRLETDCSKEAPGLIQPLKFPQNAQGLQINADHHAVQHCAVRHYRSCSTAVV